MRIVIINGPNLNLLGRREPDIYGNVSFEAYLETLKNAFPQVGFDYFQSNHEGALIDRIQADGFDPDTAIVLNAAGYTHTSVALADAVRAVPATVAEVHLSDISRREPYRAHSFLAEVCPIRFIGFGLDSYRMAVEALLAETEALPAEKEQ